MKDVTRKDFGKRDRCRVSQPKKKFIIAEYILLDYFYAVQRVTEPKKKRYRRLYVACLPANVEGDVFVLDHVPDERDGRQR